ncbi:MAG: DUF2793 domain-containing protein [Promethearchaeota archaeon]
MRKRPLKATHLVLLFLLPLCSVLLPKVAAQTYQDDAYEDNDSLQDAKSLAPNVLDDARKYVWDYDALVSLDADYFKLEVGENMSLTVNITCAPTETGTLSINIWNGTQFVQVKNGTTSNGGVQLTLTGTNTTYYIVGVTLSSASNPLYNLYVETSDVHGDDRYEENDDFPSAAQLNITSEYTTYSYLENLNASDDDFFEFKTYAHRNITINITYAGGYENLDLYFFDASGNRLAASTNPAAPGSGNLETITFTDLPYSGKYVVAVREINRFESYNLLISVSGPPTADSSEWNVWPGDEYYYTVKYHDLAYVDRQHVSRKWSNGANWFALKSSEVLVGDVLNTHDLDGENLSLNVGSTGSSHEVENLIRLDFYLDGFPNGELMNFSNLNFLFNYDIVNMTGRTKMTLEVYLWNVETSRYQKVYTQDTLNTTMPAFENFTVNPGDNYVDTSESNRVRVLLNFNDPFINAPVKDVGVTSPPGSPSAGDRYIVGPGASGDWTGHDGHIAQWGGSDWLYFAPNDTRAAWIVWAESEYQFYQRASDGSWAGIGSSSDYLPPVGDKDLNTPPGSPSIGDRYIVASGGSGAWQDKDFNISTWDGAQWYFNTPEVGSTVWVNDENLFYTWTGLSWITRQNLNLTANFDRLLLNGTAEVREKYEVSSFTTETVEGMEYSGIRGTKYVGENYTDAGEFTSSSNGWLEDLNTNGFDQFYASKVPYFMFYSSDDDTFSWFQENINEIEDSHLRISNDTNNATHIVWQRRDWDGDYEIFYSNNTQGSFGTPVRVTNNHIDDINPDMVVDKNNVVHLTWQRWDGNDYEVMYHNNSFTTQDGTGLLKGFENLTHGEVALTRNSGYDIEPNIGVRGGTNIFIVWSSNLGPGYDIMLANSTAFFQGIVLEDSIVSGMATKVTNDHDNNLNPEMAIESSGEIHIAWLSGYGDAHVEYTRSSWSYNQLTVNTVGDNSEQVLAVKKATNEVYLRWQNNIDGDYDILGTNLLVQPSVKSQTSLPSSPGLGDRYIVPDFNYQTAVLDNLTAPPGSPSTGDRYMVGSGATGAWAGHDNDLAEWKGGSWTFSTPTKVWAVYMNDESTYYGWDGSWKTHAWLGTTHEGDIAVWNGGSWSYSVPAIGWATAVEDENKAYACSVGGCEYWNATADSVLVNITASTENEREPSIMFDTFNQMHQFYTSTSGWDYTQVYEKYLNTNGSVFSTAGTPSDLQVQWFNDGMWNKTRAFWWDTSFNAYIGSENGTLIDPKLNATKLLRSSSRTTLEGSHFYSEYHFDNGTETGANLTIFYNDWGALQYATMIDENGTMFLSVELTGSVLMPTITNISLNYGEINTTSVKVVLHVEALGADQMQIMGDIVSNTPWLPYFTERTIELKNVRGNKTVQVRVRNGHRMSDWSLVRIYYDKQTGRGIPGYSVPLQVFILATVTAGVIGIGFKRKRFQKAPA